MGILFEIVFNLVLEFLLGLIGEALVEFGFHSAIERIGGRMAKPILTAIVYGVCAFLLGMLSVLFIPRMGFPSAAVATVYFIGAPLVAGLALCLMNWIIHHDIERVSFFQFGKFVYGAVFVVSFSLARAVTG